MADVEISYKGSQIASMSASGVKTLLTGDSFCEDDIVVSYTKPSTQSKTVSPSTSQQTVSPDPGFLLSSVTVNAMPSGTAGTPSAVKSSVANHSVTVTPSVTNTTGYITGGTLVGTPASVSASELVSGTLSITDNGTGIDVTNYASVDVSVSGGGGGISISPYSVRAQRGMPMGSDWTFTVVKAATDTQGNMYLTSESGVCNPGMSVTFTDLAMVDGYVYITLCGNTQAIPNGVFGRDTYNPQTYFDTINGSDHLFMIQPTENTVIDFM